MRHVVSAIQGLLALLLATAAAAQGAKPLSKCAPDAVLSGSVCMDKYEASVWRVSDPNGVNLTLVTKIRQGNATLTDLLAGARQLGTVDDYAPCSDGGQDCTGLTTTNPKQDRNIFAVSLAGVAPSAHISWFQAQQACKASRKRLPSSAEWQAAAAGTLDPGPDNNATDCNTASTLTPAPAGSRDDCVSLVGAFDMAGNLSEWVADSVPLSEPPSVTPCGTWSTGDEQCLNGERVETAGPGVLLRGGNAKSGSGAGPLAITDAEPDVPTTSTTTTTTTTSTTDSSSTSTTTTTSPPTTTTLPPFTQVGFRCVR